MPKKLINLFLKSRGYTPDYLQKIDQSQDRQLQNMPKMSAILAQIRQSQEKIVIMPDFDCDGVSSGIVGYAGLCQLGFNVSLYMPHPEQGYGLTINDVKRVKQAYPDTKWLLTCDVGQTCYQAFTAAYKYGLKVLVTDHHEQVKSKKSLLCECVVNPCQFNENYNKNRPNKNFNICGAFVLFKVLQYYTYQYQPDQANLIDALSVFAGIGTEGDMMPLIQENRALIKDTVAMLNFIRDTPQLKTVLNGTTETYFNAFNGLKILLTILDEKHKIFGQIDEDFIGWTLVPMINSVKRLNLAMTLVFGIFFNTSIDQQIDCAEKLITANDYRKVLVKKYLDQLKQEVINQQQPLAPFIYFTDAAAGVLGLLANDLKQKVNLPVFVINKTSLSGSGRSFSYFPVIKYTQNTEFFIRGHQLAFGVRFKDQAQIERFYQFLLKVLPPLVKQGRRQKQNYDLELLLDNNQAHPALTAKNGIEFVHDAAQLKPFGEGFKAPDLAIGVLNNQAEFKVMGKQKQHLKIILPGDIELISWNNAQQLDKLRQQDSFVFHGDLSINQFHQKTTLQMVGKLAP